MLSIIRRQVSSKARRGVGSVAAGGVTVGPVKYIEDLPYLGETYTFPVLPAQAAGGVTVGPVKYIEDLPYLGETYTFGSGLPGEKVTHTVQNES